MKRKSITKAMRKDIYDMYNGHCAYCGSKIEFDSFHVDHLLPVREIGGKMDNPENDVVDNLMPSCRSCNMRKGSLTLECFRSEMERSVEVLKRDSTTFKFAERYGQVLYTPCDVEFYFEKFNEGEIRAKIRLNKDVEIPDLFIGSHRTAKKGEEVKLKNLYVTMDRGNECVDVEFICGVTCSTLVQVLDIPNSVKLDRSLLDL